MVPAGEGSINQFHFRHRLKALEFVSSELVHCRNGSLTGVKRDKKERKGESTSAMWTWPDRNAVKSEAGKSSNRDWARLNCLGQREAANWGWLAILPCADCVGVRFFLTPFSFFLSFQHFSKHPFYQPECKLLEVMWHSALTLQPNIRGKVEERRCHINQIAPQISLFLISWLRIIALCFY